jgi:hypothetical protein
LVELEHCMKPFVSILNTALEYGFILALVCLLLGLVWALLTFVPQAVSAAMNSGVP